MNDFLAKYGYFLEKRGQQVIIHHKVLNYGCIHIIFVVLLIPCMVLSFYFIGFTLVLIPLAFVYLLEVDKRKKHQRNTILDFQTQEIIIQKKKKDLHYSFSNALSVVATSEHIGGFASADKETTEEYRREVNVVFKNSDILTLFSYVSDDEDEEPEVAQLVNWLEKSLKLN